MISARSHQLLRELTHRRGRTALTIITIAVAIAGIWMFAIPGNVRSVIGARVDVDAMHTARLAPNAADLDPEQLATLRSVDNVAALNTRTLARDEIRIDGRIEGVIFVGVDDFDQQSVNIVSLDDGVLPRAPGELVTDTENGRSGRLRADVGDVVEVRTSRGSWEPFEVVGRGGTLRYSSEVRDDAPVLYMTSADVQRVMGYPAANSIDIVATDPAPEAVDAMITDVRTILAAEIPGLEYWDVLEVWRPGTWPGSDDVGNFVVVFAVVAGVALASALILIFTTMNTMVRERRRDIGVMKAVGAPRRAIAGWLLGTAAVLGAAGTALGMAIGIPFSNWLMDFMSRQFGGVEIGIQISTLALVLSLAVGIGGTALAAVPAAWSGMRVTVRQAIEEHGVLESYGGRRLDRALARVPMPSRRARLGLRNAGRRVGRTTATAVPIGLAVATMLGFGATLITLVAVDQGTFDLEGADIVLWDRAPGLDDGAGPLIESVDEVEFAHPMTYSSVELDGERYVWGLPAVSSYEPDLRAGRWFTDAEDAAANRVVVVGEATANQIGLDVGDTVSVETRRGPLDLEVIGIDGQLVNNAEGMFMPFRTVLDYEDRRTGNWWVRTIDPSPSTVDAAAAGIHRTLERHGYTVESTLRYIERDQNEAENRLIVTVVMAMGLPVVAIGMIGLVSATASNVLDRRREIGILRSIGARRRDVLGIFRVEALVTTVLGWLVGIPVGYALARLILEVFERRFDVAFTFRFPLWPIAVALVVTVATTAVVMWLPLRRVARMSPGAALRYE